VWPTKWPQYTLILTPALCLSAASALRHIYHWLREQETYWDWLRQMIPAPPLSFWVLGGVLVVAVAVIYTAATLDLTLGRLGWSHMTIESTLLPSNIVYDLLVGSDEDPEQGMILATERGAAVWLPPETTDLPDHWRILTTENSGLPNNRVLSLARDSSGNIWFGTEAGLARYGQGEWQTHEASDMGLAEDRVYALATGSDGRLWVGTSTGAAALEGSTWEPLTTATSGLVDNWVQTLAVEPAPEGDRVWFGTERGLSRLDTNNGEWTSFTEGFDQGVGDLLLDGGGNLWAGTMGNGLGRWDGQDWQFYRTSNSEIPNNTVTALAEIEPGVLWIGTAEPMEAGGALAEFIIPDDPTQDEGKWRLHAPRNSGFSAAEPLIIVQDQGGRWWIGTRTTGIDIYQSTQ
jgi:ligand-binding sensor domain-containing protein